MLVCPRCRSVYSSSAVICDRDSEKLIAPARPPLVGSTIDRYVLDELISQGSMGCVYREDHKLLSKRFAVKVLFRDLGRMVRQVERLRREATALAKIAHKNIVAVHDFITTPDGVHALVMELVEGQTLQNAIEREAPFSPARTAH